MGLHVGLVSEA